MLKPDEMIQDNGWMRSLSQLIIIGELMNRIKVDDKLPEVPKPSEYFDMMGGSGTGGHVFPLFLRFINYCLA